MNQLNDLSNAMADLVSRSARGVVAVKSGAYRSASGVLLPDGIVAVCHHSLRRDGRVPILYSGGEQTTGTILGRHPALDLAFLKPESPAGGALEAAPPDQTRPGMIAAAVGMTLDVGATASFGVVGAVGSGRGTWRGGTVDQFIRLDVNLYPSQTGAAVVDAEGRLIGLATPAMSRHSTVAIPAATLLRTAAELSAEGRIRQGYLGLGTQKVAIPRSQQSQTGLMLVHVEPDSPAEQGGLLLGDILVAVDGTPVAEPEELQSILGTKAVGTALVLDLLRAGEPTQRTVTVGERRKADA